MKSYNKTGGYPQWSHCTGGSGANRDGQLEESATCGTLDSISSNTPLGRRLSSSSSSPTGGGSAQFAVCNPILVRVRVSLKRIPSLSVSALRRVRYSRMGGPNSLVLQFSV
uniref:Orf110b n=1 Tax=Batis maritima TaxID=4436 RepID=A0A068BBS6_BATMA|nr:orf110b [Batis maritima]AIC83375.1 orf110b [Batis maritima]